MLEAAVRMGDLECRRDDTVRELRVLCDPCKSWFSKCKVTALMLLSQCTTEMRRKVNYGMMSRVEEVLVGGRS